MIYLNQVLCYKKKYNQNCSPINPEMLKKKKLKVMTQRKQKFESVIKITIKIQISRFRFFLFFSFFSTSAIISYHRYKAQVKIMRGSAIITRCFLLMPSYITGSQQLTVTDATQNCNAWRRSICHGRMLT